MILAAGLGGGPPAVDIFVPGEIVPFVRVGRERSTARARAYHGDKARLRRDAASIMLARGVRVDVGAFLGSWAVETEFYRSRAVGDGDNLQKTVLDALQGLLWEDDKQVRTGVWSVCLCSSPAMAGVRVSAWPLAEKPRGDPSASVLALIGGAA